METDGKDGTYGHTDLSMEILFQIKLFFVYPKALKLAQMKSHL